METPWDNCLQHFCGSEGFTTERIYYDNIQQQWKMWVFDISLDQFSMIKFCPFCGINLENLELPVIEG